MAALPYTAVKILGVSQSPFDLVTARSIATNPMTGIHFMSGRGLPYRDQWPSVSGVVTDFYGNPEEAEVIAFSEDRRVLRGSSFSDSITGAYTFSVPFAETHYVIKKGSTENSLIFSGVIPV